MTNDTLEIDPFARMRVQQQAQELARSERISLGQAMQRVAPPPITPAHHAWSACTICYEPGPDDFPGWPDEDPSQGDA